jgi:hypothetical protein
MGDENTGVIDATSQIVVLSFELLDAELPLLPEQLEKALTSSEVQESIKKTLQQFAETKVKGNTSVISAEETKKLAESMVSGVKDAATKSLEEQIKKTPQYKKLEESVTSFQKAVKASEFGIFVDRNKGILYVIGAALVIGGAGALYITKTDGGVFVKTPVDMLKGKDFNVLSIGSFKLSASLLEFKPDARLLGAELAMTQNWEHVKLKIKLGILAEGVKVQQVKGEAIVTSGNFSVTATGDVKPYTQNVNLGLKFNYSQDVGKDKFSLSVGALYDDKNVKGTLGAQYQMQKGPTFGLTGNVDVTPQGQVGYGAMLNLTIPIKGL